MKEGETYRWVTTSTEPLYVGAQSINEDFHSSHASMARRIGLYGRVYGGFLTINREWQYEFCGEAHTVTGGNAATMENALKRGLRIV